MAITEALSAATATSPEANGVEVGKPGGELGKNEFLNLLVAQMQHQDPLDPVDNKEMIAQLAQFSALEQMQNLNTQTEKLRQSQAFNLYADMFGNFTALVLKSGEVVEGTPAGINWRDGEAYIQMDSATEVPLSEVVKFAMVTQEELAAAIAAQNPASRESGTGAESAPAAKTAAVASRGGFGNPAEQNAAQRMGGSIVRSSDGHAVAGNLGGTINGQHRNDLILNWNFVEYTENGQLHKIPITRDLNVVMDNRNAQAAVDRSRH